MIHLGQEYYVSEQSYQETSHLTNWFELLLFMHGKLRAALQFFKEFLSVPYYSYGDGEDWFETRPNGYSYKSKIYILSRVRISINKYVAGFMSSSIDGGLRDKLLTFPFNLSKSAIWQLAFIFFGSNHVKTRLFYVDNDRAVMISEILDLIAELAAGNPYPIDTYLNSPDISLAILKSYLDDGRYPGYFSPTLSFVPHGENYSWYCRKIIKKIAEDEYMVYFDESQFPEVPLDFYSKLQPEPWKDPVIGTNFDKLTQSCQFDPYTTNLYSLTLEADNGFWTDGSLLKNKSTKPITHWYSRLPKVEVLDQYKINNYDTFRMLDIHKRYSAYHDKHVEFISAIFLVMAIITYVNSDFMINIEDLDDFHMSAFIIDQLSSSAIINRIDTMSQSYLDFYANSYYDFGLLRSKLYLAIITYVENLMLSLVISDVQPSRSSIERTIDSLFAGSIDNYYKFDSSKRTINFKKFFPIVCHEHYPQGYDGHRDFSVYNDGSPIQFNPYMMGSIIFLHNDYLQFQFNNQQLSLDLNSINTQIHDSISLCSTVRELESDIILMMELIDDINDLINF